MCCMNRGSNAVIQRSQSVVLQTFTLMLLHKHAALTDIPDVHLRVCERACVCSGVKVSR